MTAATSGPQWRVPLAYYDPESASWRMSQGMFLLDLPMSSLTLPRWGMTRRGELFELPTPALLTVGLESLSLLGTPRCADGMHNPLRQNVGNPRGRLEDQVSLLPTPRATDGTKGGPNQRGSSGDLMLPSAVQLLPTPTTEPQTGNGHARNLGKEVTLLPTPTAADAAGARNTTSGRRAIPPSVANGSWSGLGWDSLTDWACKQAGATTNPLSAAGKPCSDDQPPDLLSLDEPESA